MENVISQEEAGKEQKRAEELGRKFNQLANKMQAKLSGSARISWDMWAKKS